METPDGSLTSTTAFGVSARQLDRRAGLPSELSAMQDRYAGDLGDFLKLGLLDWLAASNGSDPPLSLGVVWYLTDDEAHNDDGKHIAYLDPSHRLARHLRPLAPDLYDRLAEMVGNGDRSVAALERNGVLPPGTRTYAERLSYASLPPGASTARRQLRGQWLSHALDSTLGCDLVFMDPDNGLRPANHPVPKTRTKAVKHAYIDELAPFVQRGQSLVAYHHADRSAPVPKQAEHRLADLASGIAASPLAAVRASRGTTRLFLVVSTDAHRQRLCDRLAALERSPWASELQVYWYVDR